MNRKTAIFLSVIIPTRNRASFVADLLDTLAVQVPVPFCWEVIVIDNGSTDQTAELVKEKISSLPIEIRYFYEPRPGLHNGRHRGALEARGSYLAYLDDDVLLTPPWIHGLEKLTLGQAEAVVGRILPKWETRPPTWLTTLIRAESGYLSLLDKGSQGFYIDPSFVYGDNFFIPAQVVFELGGFHPDSMPGDQLRYRGDGESALMMRFKKAGLRAWYDPIATVYHRIPRTRASLDYLRKRAYAQGISDSFAEIRARHFDNSDPTDKKASRPELIRKNFRFYADRIREKSLSQLFSSLATRIMKLIPFSQPNIKERLNRAHLAGYNYHQNEVRKDSKLLKWVLQESYWDCKPEE
jgi:glycosyltransferase involved in cell wall biosynthesis